MLRQNPSLIQYQMRENLVFPLATTLAKSAYLAVSGDFSIIESGCALEVDIGGELRVWYFTGETDLLGGYLSGSASGEVACIMSVRGKLSVEVERLLEGEGARVSRFVLMMATTITSAPVPPSLGSLVRCWAWMVRAQDLEELGGTLVERQLVLHLWRPNRAQLHRSFPCRWRQLGL